MCNIEGFHAAVAKSWTHSWFCYPIAILYRNLKLLKTELVTLNKSHENIHVNVQTARQHLSSIQEMLDSNPINHILLVQESAGAHKLDKALQAGEALLHQKARVMWLELGDGNNSFFFSQVKGNWNYNKILALKNDLGQMVFGQNAVSNVAVDYFSKSLGFPRCLPGAT